MHKRGLRIDAKLERAAHGRRRAVLRDAARIALWRAQCNCPYWHGVFGGLYLNYLRYAVWHNLIEAERLADGVLLVHNRGIDVSFLKEGHARTGVSWKKPVVVDTVDLIVKAAERRKFLRPDGVQMPSLNLSEARRAHGLPDYQAHDALIDAVSTAELFLVLRQVIGAKTLRDLR